jgi:hypothetical protein
MPNLSLENAEEDFKLDLKTPIADPIRCVAKVASEAQVSEITKRHTMDILRM